MVDLIAGLATLLVCDCFGPERRRDRFIILYAARKYLKEAVLWYVNLSSKR